MEMLNPVTMIHCKKGSNTEVGKVAMLLNGVVLNNTDANKDVLGPVVQN